MGWDGMDLWRANQVSGVKKSVKEQGDIWVVAKTLKAFNRLRVAWEEDYGASSIPVEPPPARWADCSESDWVSEGFGVGGGKERMGDVCLLCPGGRCNVVTLGGQSFYHDRGETSFPSVPKRYEGRGRLKKCLEWNPHVLIHNFVTKKRTRLPIFRRRI